MNQPPDPAIDPTRSAYRPIAPLGILVLLCVGSLMIPLPKGGRVLPSLGDMAHAPMFALVTMLGLLTWFHLRPTERIDKWSIRVASVSALMFAFGVVTEIVQGAIGRSASVHDVVADCGGIAAAICFFVAWKTRRSKTTTTLAVVFWIGLGLVFIAATWRRPLASIHDSIALRQEFPLLGSFERHAELERWHFEKCSAKRIPMPTRSPESNQSSSATAGDRSPSGNWALRVDYPARLRSSDNASSATLYEMNSDWTQYQALTLEALVLQPSSESETPIELAIQIIDADHGKDFRDICRTVFTLIPGQPTRLTIPKEKWMTNSGRSLDLKRIRYLDLQFASPGQSASIRFDAIRLLP